MKRAVVVWAVAACSGRSSPPVAGARLGPALRAALVAADGVQAPWRCAAPDGPGASDETLVVGARRWQLAGHAMTVDAGDLAIGVIADAGGGAPATLAALGRLHARLAGVDLVIALGGMAGTRGELDAVLAALADPRWPVVALPGDLEPAGALSDAVGAARRRGAAVIDGRLIQRVELASATIALVPGAGAPSRLVAGAEGCAYDTADAEAALRALADRPGLRVLASAEAPRDAADTTGERALAGAAIDVALHGPTSPAATPARRGGRDGRAVALSPGTSDALPRLPELRRSPSAGILTVHGGAWSWQPIADVK